MNTYLQHQRVSPIKEVAILVWPRFIKEQVVACAVSVEELEREKTSEEKQQNMAMETWDDKLWPKIWDINLFYLSSKCIQFVKTFKCKRCFIISTYAATLHWKMHSSRFLVWIAFWAAPDSEHPAKEASAQVQSLLPMLQLAWDIFRYMISFANKTKYKVQQFWHPNKPKVIK